MKSTKNIFLLVIAFIIGFALSKITGNYSIVKKQENVVQQDNRNDNYQKEVQQSEQNSTNNHSQYQQYNNNDDDATEDDSNSDIPKKVFEVIEYIKKYDKAPDGYVGGRQFMNYEKLLPQVDNKGNKIKYREWDVNPKIEGKNRGKERLVSNDDGVFYYTNDHYQSFTEVK